ncbi:putative leucine-rich repeat-containing protein DDB_G0290503 isoform X2 [Epinephelus fuscoguttatus]|uniref:putative leucine-rich repeat-containing protein DDB_G0290503 isoform X2 n=1 Tax=Epinephelus fuscoguttatus TaxID=293821 RepID=UPI0020D12659|nr:putative leucine-rich repeat-containing protein DDB_G0290503 isoform X2 [Epinephelus fuscoguttatus]
MAGGSRIIWIPVLLSCVFQASDNRHVHQDYVISRTGNPDVDQIISKIPITLPEGIDPRNINVTSVVIKTCTGVEEQVAQLNSQLQQTALRNRQLDNEAFGLRREVRLLNLQLATCSSTASAITGSYQTQLLNKMNQLLETFDSDAFLTLKIIALTREVSALQRKVNNAANSTEPIDIRVLQRELQDKMDELNVKTQQIKGSHTNSTLILQIISLQNQIWDLERAESRGGVTSLQANKRIQALQQQLDRELSELRGKGDADSTMLELISVHSKIAAVQRLISVHIEESRNNAADYQRQWRQRIELLKKKILQLNREEHNTELTKEILILQAEVEHYRQLMMNAKKTTYSRLQELRVILEEEKRKQEDLQKQLEESEYAQAQLIMKIISIMKEVRELNDDEQHQTTSPNPATTLQTLLQAKEREFEKAQAEINELQRKLKLKSKEYSGLEERHKEVETKYKQKIAELSKTGDTKATLILKVINLHDALKTLRDQISTTADPHKISELQRQLEEKQAEMNSYTAEIERLIHNPEIILTVIELQNKIWDIQRQAANGTTDDRIVDLQDRVQGLLGELDNKDDANIKLMLRILTLESQVEHLQRQLSDHEKLRTTEVTQLTNDLKTKKKELQKYANELNEKNQTNTRLILEITDLHNQLRNLEKEMHDDKVESSLTVTQLREKLKAKMAEHSHDKAEIKVLQTLLQAKEKELASAQAAVKELQRKLKLKVEECSGLEERYVEVKTEFEQKIAELNRTGDSKAALILNVINLHDGLKTLRDQIRTADPDKISELQRQLEEKQEELNSKTADIERLIPNPKIILTVIELQNEIWDLQAANKTIDGSVKELQDRVDGLISQIEDKGDDNTKLVLRILTLQSQVEQLRRQLSDLQKLRTTEVTKLTNDLKTKTEELQKYVNELNEKNQTNARLILTTTDLHNQLRNLASEKQNEEKTASAVVTKLREQLKAKVEEHSRDQADIKALQNKLIETEAQCSGFEEKLKGLQNDLDTKMKELQSKSESITSLALQISTLTLQVEELKRQLQNTESETKIKELQKIIEEKNSELAQKKKELKERSTQPQRLLQIIAIQTQIERLANVASNDTDYAKISALQDHLNYLVEGIQDENNENTKLMFKILSQQDEIARLEKQAKRQSQAASERIKDLENELEDIRNQISEKTLVLDSSDTRIANLSAQIIELHKKIKPLEEEISEIKETNAENLAELQKKLDLSKRQLQDSEVRLNEADAKNFQLIMEIADLRTQLKKAQKKASKAAEKNSIELEQQLQTQQKENRRLENTNKDLKEEIKELQMCCTDVNTQCDDLQRQLQQSQEDADRLQQQLHDKDANLKQLQQELEQQNMENITLQHEYNNLERQLEQARENADYLQQLLSEKDATLKQLQQELEEQTRENNKLQSDYDNLQNEKTQLEDTVQELQSKLTDEEDKTIHTKKMTLDPNTAHPRIALSADNTEMSTSEEIQNVPDHPGRYDSVLAVLGTTGFSSGKQYWEVSVAGKHCFHIGMASESAPRKGHISFSPRNGFWTLVLNKQGQYRAIDRTSVTIPLQTQPITLGILLDYKKGEVVFYDAGARTHIYSFVGQSFTDKIHPFINFCVEDTESQVPIVLLSPGSVDWIYSNSK